MTRRTRLCAWAALAAALMAAAGCAHGQHHPLHQNGEPAITGNPAADLTLPPRFGRPGRLLLRCAAPADRGSASWEMYASAQDFDEGKQTFYLKRTEPDGREILYPLHGHFLNGSLSGIFMVHDGKGTKQGETFLIDQSVNMGVLFFHTTNEGIRAALEVFAEENVSATMPAAGKPLAEMSCRMGEGANRLTTRAEHVRTMPNSGATPPSHWFRESDRTILTCTAPTPAGNYRFELLGSTIWPGHLGFLVLRAPGHEPVGYNVHLLKGPGRLLIHAHSYPHRTRARPFDTMEETETVIGGLLLVKTENGYEGWVGLAGSSADPYNISFSHEATLGDYAAMGRVVVPPLPVTCR
jgi:hypothetical protein